MTDAKWSKTVIITTRFGPNYLRHIIAVARIGYNSEYADTYKGTIDSILLRLGHLKLTPLPESNCVQKPLVRCANES